ncbi:MAG: hypothetical protein ACREL1_08260 [bacterium]
MSPTALAPQLEEIEVPSTEPIPCSMELAVRFQRFIKYWAQAEVDYLGYAPDDNLDLPVEISVRWTGSVKGTLVIRCYPEYLKWLADSRAYKPLNLCTEKEIFNEMGTLYGIYLIQHFWLSEIFELGPVLARPSTPDTWPRREPDSTCSLLVGSNPLEIRLWVD